MTICSENFFGRHGSLFPTTPKQCFCVVFIRNLSMADAMFQCFAPLSVLTVFVSYSNTYCVTSYNWLFLCSCVIQVLL